MIALPVERLMLETLVEGARQLGLVLTPAQLAAFQTYYEELVAWNRRFNLTAITDYQAIQVRHFLDSLSCLLALRTVGRLPGRGQRTPSAAGDGLRVIDVGTGAGFPGLPLKIVCPEMRLTLLEATGKKTRFLEHIVARLGLRRVTVIHGRAEELGHVPGHREGYDWVLARAVAEMPTLAEYLLPLCRVGGHCLAQKGEDAPAEVTRAERAITLLGGEVNRLIPVELPGLAETRYLVVVDKVATTPEKYPRRPGIPSKRPLG